MLQGSSYPKLSFALASARPLAATQWDAASALLLRLLLCICYAFLLQLDHLCAHSVQPPPKLLHVSTSQSGGCPG